MATNLQLVSMLGIKAGVSGGLAYLDESDVQYVCGRNLIRFDSETRIQRVLQGSLEATGITAVAVSAGRQRYVHSHIGALNCANDT